MRADRLKPPVSINALLPISASLTEWTRFIDTAAPIPTFVVLPAVVPSAAAFGSALPSDATLPSVLFEAASVSAPAAVTLPPTGTKARTVEF